MEGGIRNDGIVDGGAGDPGVDGEDPTDEDPSAEDPVGERAGDGGVGQDTPLARALLGDEVEAEEVAEEEPDDGLGDLVRTAAGGDQEAWAKLVRRLGGIPWTIARSYGMSDGDGADISQVTWLRLVEHIGRLRDPSRVRAWLAVTARRECFRLLRRLGRQIPGGGATDVADQGADADRAMDLEVDVGLLAKERLAAFQAAFALIPESCRKLLNMLMQEPPPSYERIGASLGMPVGGIGPTRRRCLEKLRRKLEESGITHS